MPLAAALAVDNLDCQINKISGETEKYWNAMKAGRGDKPKIFAEDIVFIGVRDAEEPEKRLIEALGIKNYKVDEIRYRGLETCMNEALNKLSHCDHIYISFDVDSMDCDLVSYGTGTPVAKGFDQYEIINIINHLIASKKVVALEFVEVNPLLDTKGNKMAETAFEVLEAITKTLEIN
jgi:arginase